jgi:hypothetical protein
MYTYNTKAKKATIKDTTYMCGTIPAATLHGMIRPTIN